jgi:hypothetical protein
MGSSNEGSTASWSAQKRCTTAFTEGIVGGRSSVLEDPPTDLAEVGRAGGGLSEPEPESESELKLLSGPRPILDCFWEWRDLEGAETTGGLKWTRRAPSSGLSVGRCGSGESEREKREPGIVMEGFRVRGAAAEDAHGYVRKTRDK